jgi:hypothetical protein
MKGVTRCSFCGGRFGLIRHRHFTKQFCKATCKEQYLQDLARQGRVSGRIVGAWSASAHGPPSSGEPPVRRMAGR